MITIKVKKLTSFTDKSKGLIGYSKPFPILIHTRFGIHTFGLKYPIDVLVLDSEGKIQKLVKNLKPLRFVLWNPSHDTVVELPNGYIQKHKIKKDTIIKLYYT